MSKDRDTQIWLMEQSFALGLYAGYHQCPGSPYYQGTEEHTTWCFGFTRGRVLADKEGESGDQIVAAPPAKEETTLCENTLVRSIRENLERAMKFHREYPDSKYLWEYEIRDLIKTLGRFETSDRTRYFVINGFNDARPSQGSS